MRAFFVLTLRLHQTHSKRLFYLTTTAQHRKRICAVTLRWRRYTLTK
nr:MAG TPA: hypothetical protein [Caudoviricetes sp.]